MNADIPLTRVSVGMHLMLGGDPLLDPDAAARLLSRPERVIAVHRGGHPDEMGFIRDGGVVVPAEGWCGPGHRAISFEMTGPGRTRIMVSFPYDGHIVPAVDLPDPEPLQGPADASRRAPRRKAATLVVDPGTHHAHDARDLSAYRLPAFWRDASVVWALPIPSPGQAGPHRDPLVSEAIAGILTPSPADIAAAETPIHEDVSFSTATLCWNNAVETAIIGPSAADPVLQPVLQRLVSAYGSMEGLRSAAAKFADRRLALSGADLDYARGFIAARTAFARGRRRAGDGTGGS